MHHTAQISHPPLMTHFLSLVTDWNRVKGRKKGEKRSWIKWTWVRLSISFWGHAVIVKLHLKSLQYACAGCPATQEALFKIWGGGGLSQKADSLTQQHFTYDASPPLYVPAPCNLFACLCQRRLRSSCSSHSELIDPSSAGKHITLCHPYFELCNLPLPPGSGSTCRCIVCGWTCGGSVASYGDSHPKQYSQHS